VELDVGMELDAMNSAEVAGVESSSMAQTSAGATVGEWSTAATGGVSPGRGV
jgi:hypothetical protein